MKIKTIASGSKGNCSIVLCGKNNFIIVLNDNKMSISKNVGALSRSLTKMRNKPRYHYFKFALSNFLLKIPFIGKFLNS